MLDGIGNVGGSGKKSKPWGRRIQNHVQISLYYDTYIDEGEEVTVPPFQVFRP
jgi:hypothetical protein